MGILKVPKKKPIKHLPAKPIWYSETEAGHKIFMNSNIVSDMPRLQKRLTFKRVKR